MNDEEKCTWERRYRYANLWSFRCSNCNITCPHSQNEKPQYVFCPHCGKPMSLEEKEKE